MAGFGAFGKIPALGDFLRIGLPPAFIDPWDGWLQGALSGARHLLGDRWNDCYLSAPIWRFTLAPGLAGPLAAQGVLMSSVDRVGRQFPLTLARLLPVQSAIRAVDMASGAAFAALEDVALDALEDGMTREGLARRLVAVHGPEVAGGAGSVSRLGLWSAEFGADVRRIETFGLPTASHLQAMFDMEAPRWQAAPDSEARP